MTAALASFALSACDGSGGGATTIDGGGAGVTGAPDAAGVKCPDFDPCGGDVVGTWTPDPACAAPARASGGSNCETWDVSGVVPQVAWTFRADHMMSLHLSTSGTATVTASDPCLVSNGAPIACADAGPMFASRISFAGGKASSGGCAASAAGCRCTIAFTATPIDGPGMYAISGMTMMAMLGDDKPLTFDYCVSGSKLEMRRHDTSVANGDVSRYVRQ